MDTTGNTKGWDGSVDSLPDDTLISVRLGDIRNSQRNHDELVQLMQLIGNTGRHVMVRYDPERKYNGMYFTVLIYDPSSLQIAHSDRSWRTDTENPVEAIRKYIEKAIKK